MCWLDSHPHGPDIHEWITCIIKCINMKNSNIKRKISQVAGVKRILNSKVGFYLYDLWNMQQILSRKAIIFVIYNVQLNCNAKYSHLYIYRKKVIKST